MTSDRPVGLRDPLEWLAHSDGSIVLNLPKPMRRSRAQKWRRMKSPLFFKGIIDPKNPRSTLQLGINSNADPRTIDSHFKSASRIKEIMGVTWRYHHTGASATRRGGFEVKLTQVNPRQQGEAHRWGIIFPLATKWIYVDLVAAPGGFTWDEFEGIGFNIMKSIAISD